MITVVGYDGRPLSADDLALVDAAALVVGGERHLEAAPGGKERLVLKDMREAVDAVRAAGGDAVVVASGDPGLFGPVRRFVEAGLDVQVHPALSSVQVAFARAGLPWDDALVVSAHGRDARQALNACRAHPKVAVLTGPASGPGVLGAALVGTGRELFVAERLGTAEEHCRWVSPEVAAAEQWEEPNVVLVLDRARAVSLEKGWLAGREQPGEWALPEEAFRHRDAMVTKSEVRALVLARLGPRLGDLVWDLGAGSGSVAVECARLGAAVVAVEQGPVDHLVANVAAFGVDVQVVQGTAPAALAGLPDPDAVFVGGGGDGVGDIVRAAIARGPRVVVAALATLDRVGDVQRALSPYRVDGVQLQASRLRALGEATGLAAANPVFVLWGTPR